jgi:hypothetical protein
MDEQKRQSIQFDIQQLEIQLKEIENEIQYKEDELDLVSSKLRGFGAGAGALSFSLGALSLLATRNPKIAKEAFTMGAVKGGDTGYDISEKALQALETDIALLKRDREHILRRLKTANDKLKERK